MAKNKMAILNGKNKIAILNGKKREVKNSIWQNSLNGEIEMAIRPQ
jgi:hypothetical protein